MSNQLIKSKQLGILYNNEVKEIIENIISFDNIQRDYKYQFFYDLLNCIKGQMVNKNESPAAIFTDCKPFLVASIERLLPDNEPTIRKLYEGLRDKRSYILRVENMDDVVYTCDDVDMGKLSDYYRGLTKKINAQYEMILNDFLAFLSALEQDNEVLTVEISSKLSTPNRKMVERIRNVPDRFKPDGMVKFSRRKTPKSIKDFLKITSAMEVVILIKYKLYNNFK